MRIAVTVAVLFLVFLLACCRKNPSEPCYAYGAGVDKTKQNDDPAHSAVVNLYGVYIDGCIPPNCSYIEHIAPKRSDPASGTYYHVHPNFGRWVIYDIASSLPACNRYTEGMEYIVSDSTTETIGSVISGAGSYRVRAKCLSESWIVIGKESEEPR